MTTYFVTVSAGLQGLAATWSGDPTARVVAVLSEFRHLAEGIGDRYGAQRWEFTDDGQRALFQDPEAAVRFGLTLVDAWARHRRAAAALQRPLPLGVGCHFGECALLDGGGWLGRSASLARAVMARAGPDSLLVTESVLELLDTPLYRFRLAGAFELEGDHFERRPLYQVLSFDRARLDGIADEELGASEWFLRGVSKSGTPEENGPAEADAYRRAIRLRPGYPEAHNNLAVVLGATGDVSGAAAHYQEALRLRPAYARAHYNYGVLLASTGRAAGALRHLEEAVRLRPSDAAAHHAYANVLRDRRQLDSAEFHYREALRLRPDDAEAHNNLAILLEDRDDPDGAEAHLREALRIRPDYPEAHYNLALLLEARGRAAEAEQEYRTAVDTRPAYPEAHNNLAVLLHARGSLEEAEEHYLVALRLRPADPEAHHNLALLLARCNRSAEAAEHRRIARELAPASIAFQSEMEVAGPLHPLPSSATPRRSSGQGTDLTRRERELASLIAEGLTNKQIAGAMGISERTVEKHVENAMNKLGFSSRAQIAAWAVRRT